jgi:hypothetical protein
MPRPDGKNKADPHELLGHPRAHILTAKERHRLWNYAKADYAMTGREQEILAEIASRLNGWAA